MCVCVRGVCGMCVWCVCGVYVWCVCVCVVCVLCVCLMCYLETSTKRQPRPQPGLLRHKNKYLSCINLMKKTFDLVEDRDRRRAVVNAVMNLLPP